MKIQNSTDWPDYFLRRIVAWCCREIGMRVKDTRRAKFRNARGAFHGLAVANTREITVSVGRDDSFPSTCGYHYGPDERFADRIECLVAVTAHELAHIHAFVERRPSGERDTVWEERRCLAAFRASREKLLADWSIEPAPVVRVTKAKPSIQEQRAAKVQSHLTAWKRRLKLAQTKVKKYRLQAQYYERVAAKREVAT